MRIPAVRATFVAILALGGLLTPGSTAQADDYYSYVDETFVVDSAIVDKPEVTVTGRGTTPVTITMTLRDVESAQPRPTWTPTSLQLVQNWQSDEGRVVTLTRVSGEGPVSTWRGVLHATGPSAVLDFSGVRRCHGSNSADPYVPAYANCGSLTNVGLIKLPKIQVRAVNTPVIRLNTPPATDVNAKSYTVSGRVLTTSGTPYGRRITVNIGRWTECWSSPTGRAVRTDTRGRFIVTLPNVRAPKARAGAPVTTTHCASVPSGFIDPAGGNVNVATTQADLPWMRDLPVAAPATVRLGQRLTVKSSAQLEPVVTTIRLERLHGRTAWRQVGVGLIRENGRVDVSATADRLGRYTYRLRGTDPGVISKPFIINTIR